MKGFSKTIRNRYLEELRKVLQTESDRIEHQMTNVLGNSIQNYDSKTLLTHPPQPMPLMRKSQSEICVKEVPRKQRPKSNSLKIKCSKTLPTLQSMPNSPFFQRGSAGSLVKIINEVKEDQRRSSVHLLDGLILDPNKLFGRKDSEYDVSVPLSLSFPGIYKTDFGTRCILWRIDC